MPQQRCGKESPSPPFSFNLLFFYGKKRFFSKIFVYLRPNKYLSPYRK